MVKVVLVLERLFTPLPKSQLLHHLLMQSSSLAGTQGKNLAQSIGRTRMGCHGNLLASLPLGLSYGAPGIAMGMLIQPPLRALFYALDD